VLIVVVLGILGIVAGWLIGRPRALLVTIVVPIGAVISRIQQEHEGHPPETWTAATALFTAVFALLVLAGVLLRRVTGPAKLRASRNPRSRFP
jgi:hypothetical protein